MPLYEYECDACGHRFEVIQKFSDPPVAKCPQCAGTVHKLFASPAIQFKGSGWYITDYAKKDAAGAGKAGGSKDPKESSAETKPADSGSSDKQSADSKPTPPPAKKD